MTGTISLRVQQVRDPQTLRADNDHTVGCGQCPASWQPGQVFKSGRICAGAGAENSCQLCPASPTYWRLPEGERREVPVSGPAPVSGREVEELGPTLDWSGNAGAARKVEHGTRTMKPCRYCRTPTGLRDASGTPSCKVCAERNGQTNDDLPANFYRRGADRHGA